MFNWTTGIVVVWVPWCGQPFYACHYWWHKDISKGVKWDRTSVNACAQAWNVIRPLSWIEVLSCQACVRETEAERDWVALLSYLVTHSFDNVSTGSFPLQVKHSLMHSLDVWTLVPSPHALHRKTKIIFVYQTKSLKSFWQILPSVSVLYAQLYKQMQTCWMWLITTWRYRLFFRFFNSTSTLFYTPSPLCRNIVLASVFSLTKLRTRFSV